MYPSPNQINWIVWIALWILASGCDERATRIAREAADRQAQQNTAMAELQQEVAGGTRALVEADAGARQQLVAVHRELQAERTRLDAGWTALEQERRRIAVQRRTESLLVPATKLVGGLALVLVLLGFSWYVLAAARRGDGTEEQLNELLVAELLPDEPPLVPRCPSSLLGYSGNDDGRDE
jgi:hypothetical protein